MSDKCKWVEPGHCKICNATVQKRNWFRHLQTHEVGCFLCDICGVHKAKRQDTLRDHKKNVHNVGNKSVGDCLFCRKKLPSFGILEIHLRSHTMERPHLCNLCPQECNTAQNLETHQRSVHAVKEQSALHCPTCQNEFFQKEYLKKHFKIHLVTVKALPFKCDICSKALRSREKLNIHKRVHSKEKPFPCEICNAHFSQVTNLNAHVRIHTGEKPYVCKFCQKRFSRQDTLTKHLRVHTGEKPYGCTVCKRRFRQNGHLKSHMMKTHSEEIHIPARNAK